MKPFAFRYLALLLVLLITGCQHSQPDKLFATDARGRAFEQMQQSLTEKRLDDARRQLATLQAQGINDARLQQYQRQLADAYLLQGREALQRGDLDAAAKAIGQARSLLPDAPALGSDVRQTLEQSQQ